MDEFIDDVNCCFFSQIQALINVVNFAWKYIDSCYIKVLENGR